MKATAIQQTRASVQLRRVAAAVLTLGVAACASYSPPDIPDVEAAIVSGDGVGTLLSSIDALDVYDGLCPTVPCKTPFPKRYKLTPGRHVIFANVMGLMHEHVDIIGAALFGASAAGRVHGGHCQFQLDAEAGHAYSILPVPSGGKVPVNNRLLIRDTAEGNQPTDVEVEALCS